MGRSPFSSTQFPLRSENGPLFFFLRQSATVPKRPEPEKLIDHDLLAPFLLDCWGLCKHNWIHLIRLADNNIIQVMYDQMVEPRRGHFVINGHGMEMGSLISNMLITWNHWSGEGALNACSIARGHDS